MQQNPFGSPGLKAGALKDFGKSMTSEVIVVPEGEVVEVEEKRTYFSTKAEMHTVFILCGPPHCGKSTLAAKMVKEITAQGCGVVVLSSDMNRDILVGAFSEDSHITPAMQEVSGQAFKMLMTDLEAHTSYPVNTPFVIVDTTGLDETFRARVHDIAENNGYKTHLIIFDFPHSEYFKHLPSDPIVERRYRDVIASGIKRLKTGVMPTVRKKDFDEITKVKSRVWEAEIRINQSRIGTVLEVSGEDRVIVIGDVHEHTKALKDIILLTEETYKSGVNKFVLLGDYLDKGGDTKGVIDFVWTLINARSARMIKANHENYVVKRILGEIEPNLELEANSFQSLDFLLKPENKEYADKVVEIWSKSTPFLKINRKYAHTVYVTHAPCANVHIGKYSDTAMLNQRNLRRFMKEDAREHYDFIFSEAVGNHPIHVFGHVAHCASKLNYKNKWFLDTGAVYGGKLSAMVVDAVSEQILQVQCDKLFEYEEKSLRTDAVTPVVEAKEFDIHDYDLSDDDMKFLRRLERFPIQYVSGTMAPAPSTANEIESLEAGLNYFKNKGITQVVLEPKYMGSRCQVYLFRNEPEKSFAVSRNGYTIKKEGIQKVLSDAYDKFSKLDFWEESLILDGELMPWHYLGEQLISKDFIPYGNSIMEELLDLDSDEELAKLSLKPKLKIEERLDHINVFFQQLDLYGSDGVPTFKPFQILSVDGEEKVTQLDQSDSFKAVSDDEFLLLDFSDTDYLVKAQEFFSRKTTQEMMEGIVIKPNHFTPGVAPYMKVRNESYLFLIYGSDYKLRYKALSEKKRINSKLATSIREHDLAVELLKDDGSRRTEILVKMVSELRKEKSLDPRL